MGHWYEIPNLLLNGVLVRLLDENPRLEHLFVHNIDTLGANVDPVLFAHHMESGGRHHHGSDRTADRGSGRAVSPASTGNRVWWKAWRCRAKNWS